MPSSQQFDGFWDVTEDVTIAFNSPFHSNSTFKAQTIGENDSDFITVQRRNTRYYPWAGYSADTLYFTTLDSNVLFNSLQGNIGRYSSKFDTLDFTYFYGLGADVYVVHQHWIKNPSLTYDSVFPPVPDAPHYDHAFLNDSVKSILIPCADYIYNIGDTGTFIWNSQTGAYMTPQYVLFDGINVYAATEALQAYSYNTGNRLWIAGPNNGNFGFVPTPALYNNKLFINCYTLRAYDTQTGTLLSSDTLGRNDWGIVGPYIKDSLMYIGTIFSRIYSVNASTRVENWAKTYVALDYLTCLPTVVDDVLYAAARYQVFAMDAKTGVVKWIKSIGGDVYSNPVVKNGILYVGSDDHKMYALDVLNGDTKWKFETGDKIHSTVFVDNGSVYFGSEDDSIYSLNAVTGEKNWAYPTLNPIVDGGPAVVNDVLYIGSGGYLYAIDCHNGKRIWRAAININATSPCVITKSNRAVSAFTER